MFDFVGGIFLVFFLVAGECMFGVDRRAVGQRKRIFVTHMYVVYMYIFIVIDIDFDLTNKNNINTFEKEKRGRT